MPNINNYPHIINFFLDIWYWFLMCCKVIHILWITFEFWMLNLWFKFTYLCFIKPTKIIAPVKNCRKGSHRLLLQITSQKIHLTQHSVQYILYWANVYIICQYCRRMIYLDIGSFLNNVQKKSSWTSLLYSTHWFYPVSIKKWEENII